MASRYDALKALSERDCESIYRYAMARSKEIVYGLPDGSETSKIGKGKKMRNLLMVGTWSFGKPTNWELNCREKFSVGIFKWVPKVGGKGLKRSKVVYRVRGLTKDADLVYQRAEEICELLNKKKAVFAETWLGGAKSETVKG